MCTWKPRIICIGGSTNNNTNCCIHSCTHSLWNTSRRSLYLSRNWSVRQQEWQELSRIQKRKSQVQTIFAPIFLLSLVTSNHRLKACMSCKNFVYLMFVLLKRSLRMEYHSRLQFFHILLLASATSQHTTLDSDPLNWPSFTIFVIQSVYHLCGRRY